MERIGSDTRAYHSLAGSFVWDVPNVECDVLPAQYIAYRLYLVGVARPTGVLV